MLTVVSHLSMFRVVLLADVRNTRFIQKILGRSILRSPVCYVQPDVHLFFLFGPVIVVKSTLDILFLECSRCLASRITALAPDWHVLAIAGKLRKNRQADLNPFCSIPTSGGSTSHPPPESPCILAALAKECISALGILLLPVNEPLQFVISEFDTL